MSKRHCWIVSAFDFEEYHLYDGVELNDYKNSLISDCPFISYAHFEDFHMLALIDNINLDVFNCLKETASIYGNGYKLDLNVLNADFKAISADGDMSLVRRISNPNLSINEKLNSLSGEKGFIDIIFHNEAGSKTRELDITYDSEFKNIIKECMISTFGKHGIRLDFFKITQNRFTIYDGFGDFPNRNETHNFTAKGKSRFRQKGTLLLCLLVIVAYYYNCLEYLKLKNALIWFLNPIRVLLPVEHNVPNTNTSNPHRQWLSPLHSK